MGAQVKKQLTMLFSLISVTVTLSRALLVLGWVIVGGWGKLF